MQEDDTFYDFYAKLSVVINSSFALEEVYSYAKIVNKILCSLPKRFHAKVTSLEENKELENMKVEELIGSLTTYETRE